MKSNFIGEKEEVKKQKRKEGYYPVYEKYEISNREKTLVKTSSLK